MAQPPLPHAVGLLGVAYGAAQFLVKAGRQPGLRGVFQLHGLEVRIIDYYENANQPAAHYVNWVKEGGTASSTVGAKLEAGDTYDMLGVGAVTLWAELAGTTYDAAEAS